MIFEEKINKFKQDFLNHTAEVLQHVSESKQDKTPFFNTFDY